MKQIVFPVLNGNTKNNNYSQHCASFIQESQEAKIKTEETPQHMKISSAKEDDVLV